MTTQLDHYVHQWTLTDPVLLAETPRSAVYAATRNGGDKVALKLLTPEGAGDEADGAIVLRYFDGHGAVRLLEADDGAHLLEYAGDEELAQVVWRGDDLEAAGIIADVLNKLHQPRPGVPVPPLRTLRLRFRSLFDRAARDEASGENSIYVRGARAAEYLLSTARDECVLHGDIQHHNIRRHPVRGWLAYDAKGLYGERSYDAANTLCNPSHADDRVISEARMLQVSEILADGMGVDLGRLRAFVFAYACLSASWFGNTVSAEDEHIKRQILTVAHNAERHADFSA